MKFRLKHTLFCLLIALSASPVLVLAQDDDGPPDPGPVGGEVPIDGGASLLVAGAAAYGYKKLREKRAAGKKEGAGIEK